jgi:hypothetical protein
MDERLSAAAIARYFRAPARSSEANREAARRCGAAA